MTAADDSWRAPVSTWWSRHGGLDGGIRVLGAGAVVLTIEALAGYFLWLGMTVHMHVPDQLGWTLQVGLAGGSVVGTRAFHRGQEGEWQFGLATSVAAVLFLLLDGSVAALLHYGELHINAGWLAVGALAECLIVGYLTVHTLMAGRVVTTVESAGNQPVVAKPPQVDAPSEAPESAENEPWGGPPTVDVPRPLEQSVGRAAAVTPMRRTTPSTAPAASKPQRMTHEPGWTPDMVRAVLPPGVKPASDKGVRLRARGLGVVQAGKRHTALRFEVERAELEQARRTAGSADDEDREAVPA